MRPTLLVNIKTQGHQRETQRQDYFDTGSSETPIAYQ